MRDKLIELIDNNKACDFECDCYECQYNNEPTCFSVRLADALISHGVTFADVPDNNVGKWIPVSERLPENETIVLVLAERRYAYRKVRIITMGFYTDGKHHTEESSYVWNDLPEYIEEFGAYMMPEGWWESVIYGEEFGAISDFVTHWMPLPEPPKKGE